MTKIRLSYLERKRILIMLYCLIVAIVSWMFLTLNKNYIYRVQTVVKYSNLPQKKAFHPLQSDTVSLQVEGSGWNLLFAKMRIAPPSITASLRDLNTKDFITFSNQLIDINNKLESSTQKIISIVPDTLYFGFSRRISKKVPVKLISNIYFKNPYQLADSIQVFPREVKLVGPEDDLKNIHYWNTDTLNLNKVQQSVSKTIALEQLNYSNITIEPQNVKVIVPVDEFTEKTVQVPIKILNNTNYLKVNLYPKTVQVTFMVSLKDYEDINQDFIEASIDLNDWQINKNTQLIVNLTRFPDFCKVISIVPQKIDFLIQK